MQVREDQRASRETILIFQLVVPFLRNISTCLQVDRPIFNKKKRSSSFTIFWIDTDFINIEKRIYKMRDILLEIISNQKVKYENIFLVAVYF